MSFNMTTDENVPETHQRVILPASLVTPSNKQKPWHNMLTGSSRLMDHYFGVSVTSSTVQGNGK